MDKNVIVSGTWSSDDASQETTSPPYLTNLTFQPLATNSSGEYTITVSVRPSDNSQFIVENSNSASYTLTVRRELSKFMSRFKYIGTNLSLTIHAALSRRPPTITVASRHPSSVAGCGETMALNCTANQVAGLFSPPTITWRDPNDVTVSSDSSSNPRMDPVTGQLIFSDITSGNSGTYTCQAVVDIPLALIYGFIDMDTTEVNTNCE